MCCHFLLQGIFPTQGLNPGLLRLSCIGKWVLSYQCHPGSLAQKYPSRKPQPRPRLHLQLSQSGALHSAGNAPSGACPGVPATGLQSLGGPPPSWGTQQRLSVPQAPHEGTLLISHPRGGSMTRRLLPLEPGHHGLFQLQPARTTAVTWANTVFCLLLSLPAYHPLSPKTAPNFQFILQI